MASDGFQKVMTALVFITLFAFLVITFSVSFIGDIEDKSENYDSSDKGIPELEERFQTDTLTSTLDLFETRASLWESSFKSQNIFSLVVGVIVTGMFDLTITMWAFVMSPFKLIGSVLVNVLGVPQIIAVMVNVFLTITILFGIWRLMKQGY